MLKTFNSYYYYYDDVFKAINWLVAEVKFQNENFLQVFYLFSFHITRVYALCTMHVYALNLMAKNF